MRSFSQRKGLVPIPQMIQIDSMSDDLRNSLWNVLDIEVWHREHFLWNPYGSPPGIKDFSRCLWFNFFKRPIDLRSDSGSDILHEIRSYYFKATWNFVYEFVEFVINHFADEIPWLANEVNAILEQELSGYRFVSNCFVDITGPQEIEMLEEALKDTKFSGVTAHLQQALEHLANRKNPDYRNSIKESISAVEAMARLITKSPKATLGEALKALESNGKIHSALKEGFSKLYGYTSDEQGIRHAMLVEPTISASDAKFFLLSCTSFIGYLKARM